MRRCARPRLAANFLCATNPDENPAWKSSQQLIRNLSDITSKGGNYPLNVGPDAEGIIPEPEVERLKTMGRWLRTNGAAIYGTDAGPYAKLPDWGRVTQRFNPNGSSTVYVHVWSWPANGKIVLPGVQAAALSGKLLANGAAVSSAVSSAGLVVTLPGTAPDADVSVAALEFSAPRQIGEAVIRPVDSSAGGTPLDPSGATSPK